MLAGGRFLVSVKLLVRLFRMLRVFHWPGVGCTFERRQKPREGLFEGAYVQPVGVLILLGTTVWDVGACLCAARRTEKPNAVPALLPRGPDAQAAPVRGPARLLCGGARRRTRSRAPSATRPGPSACCAIPSGATGPRSSLSRPAGPPRPAEEVRRARDDHRPPQAELLRLRDQRGAQGAQLSLSPTAVREVLKAEGFAPLPRRLDDERPARPRPTVEPVADVRAFSLAPRRFPTRCGGLFLFVPELAGLHLTRWPRPPGCPARR